MQNRQGDGMMLDAGSQGGMNAMNIGGVQGAGGPESGLIQKVQYICGCK
mgnify:CR=1 FL=1